MNVRIVGTIGKNKNPDTKKWYEAKVKELALLLVNKAKNEVICIENPTFRHEELEVIAK